MTSRLETLRRTGLLETGREPVFDRAARLATRVLGCQVSLLSLVDADRQVFKVAQGLAPGAPAETPLTHSFCRHVVDEGAPFVVSDARADPRVVGNGAIEDLDVVAYLGVPVRAPDGSVLGSLCAIEPEPRHWTEDDLAALTDVCGGVESEIAAREAAAQVSATEGRLRAVLDSIPVGVAVSTAPELDLLLLNEAGRAITGRPTTEQPRARSDYARFAARHPGGDPLDVDEYPIVRAALSGDEVRAQPIVYDTPDGRTLEIEIDAMRIDDPQHGALAIAAFRDVTARNEARREAHIRRAQLSEALEATTDGVVRLGPDWRVSYLNAHAARMIGGEPLGRLIWEVFPVSRGGPSWEALHRARATGEAQEVTWHLPTGNRWTEARAFPAGDELTVFFRDVTDARLAEDRRQLLVQELNHRVKNLFAVVSGMIGLTARSATDVSAMASDLRGRIGALAAAHELIRPAITLEAAPEAGVTLEALIEAVLSPHAGLGSAHWRVSGPRIDLGPSATTNVALALHELATNAAKHGALRPPEGLIDIAWRPEGEGLRLDWIETFAGPPRETVGAQPGFGSSLLRLSVEGQMGGTAEQDLTPEGLRVAISLPLATLER